MNHVKLIRGINGSEPRLAGSTSKLPVTEAGIKSQGSAGVETSLAVSESHLLFWELQHKCKGGSFEL